MRKGIGDKFSGVSGVGRSGISGGESYIGLGSRGGRSFKGSGGSRHSKVLGRLGARKGG